jgi:hypothetical protein
MSAVAAALLRGCEHPEEVRAVVTALLMAEEAMR